MAMQRLRSLGVLAAHLGAAALVAGPPGAGAVAAAAPLGAAAPPGRPPSAPEPGAKVTGAAAEVTGAAADAREGAAPTLVSGWRSQLTITSIIKFLCVALNLLFQASPARDIWAISARQSTGTLNPLPLICMTACGAQWSFYAVFAWYMTGSRGFLTIVYANVFGFALGIFYTAVFQANCKDKDMWQNMRIYYFCVLCFLVFEVVTLLLLPVKDSLYFAGLMAAVLSMLVCLSPYVTIEQVFKTGKLDSMPVDMILVGSISTVLWLTCGFLISDRWIIVTNIWAFVNNNVLLAIILRYHPATAPLVQGLGQRDVTAVGHSPDLEAAGKHRRELPIAKASESTPFALFNSSSSSDPSSYSEASENTPLTLYNSSPSTGPSKYLSGGGTGESL